MGDIADGMIDGTFDSLTGEYLGEGPGYPRTTDKEHAEATGAQLWQDKDGTIRDIDHNPKNFSKGTRAIRKELAILIKSKLAKCKTKQEQNHAVNLARQEINEKYGKGWREQLD